MKRIEGMEKNIFLDISNFLVFTLQKKIKSRDFFFKFVVLAIFNIKNSIMCDYEHKIITMIPNFLKMFQTIY